MLEYPQLVAKFCKQYRNKLSRNNRIWYVFDNGQWVRDGSFSKTKRIMSAFLVKHGFTAYRYLARFQFDAAQQLKYSVNI
jgi:hypothetical protein